MHVSEASCFLILGSAKCGTTSLYAYVDQHPDVFFSDPKEPIFFEAHFDRGMDYYWETYFKGWRGQPVVGEARTHNLVLPFVAERIRQGLPDARLIAILRDPVDRAYSEWWHRVSLGFETLSFEEAIEANEQRIDAGMTFDGPEGAAAWYRGLQNKRDAKTRYGLYLEQGYYARHIERFRALFPAPQLKILFFEDLSRDPEAVTREVWDFIGVDAQHRLADPDPRNVARSRKRSPLAQRVRALRPRMLRDVVPEPLLRPFRAFLSGRPAARPPLRPETARALREHFAPHNEALVPLVGRSLSHWFEPPAKR